MSKKAFLLAAGLGTRLAPLTNSIPKCLVKVCNRPLLAWWIDLFEKHSITEVLINLHYLPDEVISFLKSYNTKINFLYSYEEKLLGSAGTLKRNINFVKDEDNFFVCYADNLTNINLSNFRKFFDIYNTDCISLFYTDSPKTKGIVTLDEENTILSFEEKPLNPKTNLANAGIYLFTPDSLDLIPDYELTDIGYHLLPKLVGRMKGWINNYYMIDIGTLEHLKKAELEWSLITELSK